MSMELISVRNTRLDVEMYEEDPDSFLMQAIIPVYEKCAAVQGRAALLFLWHVSD